MAYTSEQQKILDQVDRLIVDVGSLNKASLKIGVNAGAISMLKRGSYKGNVDEIFKKIGAYFEVKTQAKEIYMEVDYAQTVISENVYKIINVCQVKGGLAIAAGDAGIGKTKACKKYIADHPNNAVLITVNPCISSVKALLRELATRVGAAPEKSRNELWYAITRRLCDGMVLIFDEAQHLPLKTIEVLRSFSDYFLDRGETLGIVFVGNLETVSRIGSKKAEFAQISNRTKQKTIYSTNQINRTDICKLFPILTKEKMDREIDFLLNIAQTPQALRGAVNLFSNAYDNDNYTYEGLVAMAKHMKLEV